MESRVGTILREARNRRKIDLPEVEAATRIRVRYLRAIENEEWDVLPGGVYTRGFIRTYASFLGLDGERLADDYRKSVESERAPTLDPVASTASRPAGPSERHWRAPRTSWIAVAAVLLVAVLAIVIIPGGGKSGNGVAQQKQKEAGGGAHKRPDAAQPQSRGVSVELTASAEVWVCMLDAKSQHLVDGQILEAGAQEGPFRSGSFIVSFGNGEVSMLVDGKETEIPATSSPIGYSIDASGRLTELDEAERPTCT